MALSLSDCLDVILSSKEPHDAQISALQFILERVAGLLEGQESAQVAAWQQSQEHFDQNVVSIVLQLIGRTVAQVELQGDIDSSSSRKLAKALSLLQGLLFLHPRSASLFERRGNLEMLLCILKTAPAKASTSASLIASDEEHDNLISQTLSALLAALVDRPRNTSVFEQIGGLADIADLLRSKKISKAVRYACLELLFFYLAPEEQTAAQQSRPAFMPSSSFVGAAAKHQHRHSYAAPATQTTNDSPRVRGEEMENPFLPNASPSRKRTLPSRLSEEISGERSGIGSTPRRARLLQQDTPGSTRLGRLAESVASTPVSANAPTIITKSPSEPTSLAEALVPEPSGPSSTPNTPERPRMVHSRRQSVIDPRLSSIAAQSPRLPLSATPSAPQYIASSTARSRLSFSGIIKPVEPSVTALRKSSLSPGQASGRSALAFSTPSPVSPRKRDSFAISRDITPTGGVANAKPARPLSASPSKRASLGSAVRGPANLGASRSAVREEKGGESYALGNVEELAEVFSNLGSTRAY